MVPSALSGKTVRLSFTKQGTSSPFETGDVFDFIFDNQGKLTRKLTTRTTLTETIIATTLTKVSKDFYKWIDTTNNIEYLVFVQANALKQITINPLGQSNLEIFNTI
ncbi:MAG: hypothetical protein KC646_00870 [Candidatus Cloacimonetes bacterium]|nr:hypothetical protein [Candidatus Cloacimonadota bacterium]